MQLSLFAQDIKERNLQEAEEKLNEKNIKYQSYVCDVGRREDLKKMFQQIREEFGRLDVLFLNAGISPYWGDQC